MRSMGPLRALLIRGAGLRMSYVYLAVDIITISSQRLYCAESDLSHRANKNTDSEYVCFATTTSCRAQTPHYNIVQTLHSRWMIDGVGNLIAAMRWRRWRRRVASRVRNWDACNWVRRGGVCIDIYINNSFIGSFEEYWQTIFARGLTLNHIHRWT